MDDNRTEVSADINKVLLVTQRRLAQITQENIIMECVISQQAEELENLKKEKENTDG